MDKIRAIMIVRECSWCKGRKHIKYPATKPRFNDFDEFVFKGFRNPLDPAMTEIEVQYRECPKCRGLGIIREWIEPVPTELIRMFELFEQRAKCEILERVGNESKEEVICGRRAKGEKDG